MTAAYYKVIPVISTPESGFHLLKTESGREDLVLEGPDNTSLCEQEVLGVGMAMCKVSLPADLTRFQNRCVGIHLK